MEARDAILGQRGVQGAVVAANVALFALLWINTLWIVDDFQVVSSSNYYVFNVRLAFWLYSLEVALELFAGALSESKGVHSLRQFIPTVTSNVLLFTVNLAGRWMLVVGSTWILLAIPSPFTFLPYLAAVLPTALWQVVKQRLPNRRGTPKSGQVVRGSKIQSFEEAQDRLAQRTKRSTREDNP